VPAGRDIAVLSGFAGSECTALQIGMTVLASVHREIYSEEIH
jgi:hypothetical protein